MLFVAAVVGCPLRRLVGWLPVVVRARCGVCSCACVAVGWLVVWLVGCLLWFVPVAAFVGVPAWRLAGACFLVCSAVGAEESLTTDELHFFETKIRP